MIHGFFALFRAMFIANKRGGIFALIRCYKPLVSTIDVNPWY